MERHLDLINTRTATWALAIGLIFRPATALCAAPDVQTIIEKSVAANQANWNAAPNYSYKVRQGTGQGSRTYEVTMILGSPYRRLIAVNGEPLSPPDAAKEQHKLEQVTAQRRAESPEQRQQRIAQYEKDRKRDHLMMEQLTKAFDFRLLGEHRLDTYNVYVLRATPRKGYKPPNMACQVLPAMRGELWIDEQSFQWVKVTAQVIRPTSIEGFLAEVEPGTRFELEKMPVDDGIWLPKHFAMRSNARILYMFSHSTQEDNTFFDYRKIPGSNSANSAGSK